MALLRLVIYKWALARMRHTGKRSAHLGFDDIHFLNLYARENFVVGGWRSAVRSAICLASKIPCRVCVVKPRKWESERGLSTLNPMAALTHSEGITLSASAP